MSLSGLHTGKIGRNVCRGCVCILFKLTAKHFPFSEFPTFFPAIETEAIFHDLHGESVGIIGQFQMIFTSRSDPGLEILRMRIVDAKIHQANIYTILYHKRQDHSVEQQHCALSVYGQIFLPNDRKRN